ncbi:hypothetical protein NL676_005033 [Syzygium grande]|nr:hypothetical protein NL676_005033 [Syzygium grande]
MPSSATRPGPAKVAGLRESPSEPLPQIGGSTPLPATRPSLTRVVGPREGLGEGHRSFPAAMVATTDKGLATTPSRFSIFFF